MQYPILISVPKPPLFICKEKKNNNKLLMKSKMKPLMHFSECFDTFGKMTITNATLGSFDFHQKL